MPLSNPRRTLLCALVLIFASTSAFSQIPLASSTEDDHLIAQGRDFELLNHPIAKIDATKPEIIEFFGYWCPHCHAMEPKLAQWVAAHPDVTIRKLPAAYRKDQVAQSLMFFALESMGREAELRAKIFEAIHQKGNKLDTLDLQIKFFATHGIDKAQYTELFNSFSIQAKFVSTQKLGKDAGLDHVPAFVVNGKYITKSTPNPLATIDALLADKRAQ